LSDQIMREINMKILLLLLALTICPIYAFAESSVQEVKSTEEENIPNVTILDVVSDPKEYHGIKVSLEGKVEGVKYTMSTKGEPFTFFRLVDENQNEVNVYYEDEHLPIEKGDTVRIMGKFKKEKRHFIYKFKNVIKARTVNMVPKAS